jgi:site-specific DNA recombinase
VWSKSAVCEILRNPKYTGYQVFNRRASKSGRGRHNPPEKWVWSAEPAHEPLIPKWMFDDISARRAAKRGSRTGHDPNRHPRTVRSYLLRGMLFCSCGRRMDANHRHGSVYYRCYPRANNRGRPDRYTGHPTMVYVNEAVLLDALDAFYADRVFGPRRRDLLAADLDGLDDTAARQRERDRQRHQRALAGITRRQHNLLRQAQDAEPADPFTAGLRASYNQLEADRRATLAAIDQLDTHDTAQPDKPTAAQAALLDALPQLALNLTRAPQPLQRRLYEATRLKIELHHETREATMTIRLPADHIPTITHTAKALTQQPGHRASTLVVDAVGAPGRIRTCDRRIRSPVLCPAELRGLWSAVRT